MKVITSAGAMPAKVFNNERAIVTAGLAKEILFAAAKEGTVPGALSTEK
jgi:hypothetical protein